MAIGSTIYHFDIALSDPARDIYESLSLRAARHSSETLEYLLCRVFAYCLEYTEGLEFSKGLDDPDTPALWARDLTGKITHWIEVGSPSPEKLHKASKNVEHVAIYTYKNPTNLLSQLRAQPIYRAEEIEFHAFESKFLEELIPLTDRRNVWSLSVSEETLYLDIGDKNFVSVLDSYRVGVESK